MMRHSLKPISCLVSAATLFYGACGAPPSPVVPDPEPQPGSSPQGSDPLSPASADSDSEAVPGELIVITQPGSDAAAITDLFNASNVTVREQAPEVSAYLVACDMDVIETARETLAGSYLVEEVSDNRLYQAEAAPDDPRLPEQWHLDLIGAPAAWDITTGNVSIRVAVLDTGVDALHPDLAGRLMPGVNTWLNNTDSRDAVGHGTAVAGIIGAVANNGQGVAPVTWTSPIIPVRVTGDEGQATSWTLAAGIRAAVAAGARVINISFAPLQKDGIVLRQCQLARLAGALTVISSGNTGKEVLDGGSEYALFVGATGREDDLASFSTYGRFVDLAAPGVSLLTTRPGGVYGTASGTSFAAPVVSGVAALVWSVNPARRPVSVREILVETARDLGPAGEDLQFGMGRIDAAAAVQAARDLALQNDRTPPQVAIESPAPNAGLSSPVVVRIQASDDQELADVTLYVDSVAVAADAVAPYQFLLNPARYAPGPHTLRAVASDTSGNTAESVVNVLVEGSGDQTRPTVRIISPANGATLTGVVTIRADAVDDRGITLAEILVDDVVVGTIPFQDVGAKIAFNWNTTGVAVGPHTVAVRASDASRNIGSATVRITVSR